MSSQSGVQVIDHHDVFADTFIFRFDKPGSTELGDSNAELNANSICQPRSPDLLRRVIIIYTSSMPIYSAHHNAAFNSLTYTHRPTGLYDLFLTACSVFGK